ncbi:MAG TPA: CsbD family protein [Acidobacteriaceae bacterium]|jgi:uncharacterized protein YjbJ (UPF0337 family)|nr:CsbD family protein [Acidobacteriaceae bacterium]
MNSDQVKGKMTGAAGKVKQATGEATGNENMANRGVADQAKGAAQETWGNIKDAANQSAQTHEAEQHRRNAEKREEVSEKIDHAKERTNEKIDEVKEREKLRRSA